MNGTFGIGYADAFFLTASLAETRTGIVGQTSTSTILDRVSVTQRPRRPRIPAFKCCQTLSIKRKLITPIDVNLI